MENLFPPGVYGFEITEASDDVAKKSGKDMIKLVLRVFDAEGRERTLYDYLLESMPHKLRHAAEACGLLDRYQTGDLLAWEFEGKIGNVKLTVRDNKERGTKENSIIDYVVFRPDGKAPPVPSSPGSDGPPPGHPASEAPPWES